MKICLFSKKNKVFPGKVIIDNNGNKKQYIYEKKKLVLVPYNNSSTSCSRTSKLFIKI